MWGGGKGGIKKKNGWKCYSSYALFSYFMQIFAVKVFFPSFFFFVNIVFKCVTYYKEFIRIF